MKHMVRGFVCHAVAAGVSFAASATTYRVTPDAAVGGNGQAWATMSRDGLLIFVK